MKVVITYCTMWNYLPTASRVEEEIKSAFSDVEMTFELGSGGDFIVEVDGKIIFSKNDTNTQRFPNEGEIKELIKKEGY